MSSQQNTESLKDQLENLNSHLVMIKSLKDSEAEVEYCNLLEKAKTILGDLSPYMAKFYYEYGAFLLNKVQSNMDLFNENAVPGAEDDDGIAEYASAYEDQSQIQQNGGNSQKIEKQEEKQEKIESKTEKGQQKEQKIVYQDENIQITENFNDKIQQKIVQKQEQAEVENGINVEDSTDLEIAYENLQVALMIFQNQRNKLENGEDSVLQKDQIFKYTLGLHSRIGELYMFDERFDDSINQYNALIKMTKGNDAPQLRRRISEAHYNIGNCYLHQNKENCQMLAIEEYIAAHEELLKFIEETQNYEISKIQVPTLKKFKVDRFGYLYKPFDSELVRDMKDVMSLLLDKIEDTALQIQTRPSYEREKAKMNELKENSGFKEVSKDVKVTNLGTFGNRKRAEPPSVLQEARNQVEKVRASAIPEPVVKESKQVQKESKEQTVKVIQTQNKQTQ